MVSQVCDRLTQRIDRVHGQTRVPSSCSYLCFYLTFVPLPQPALRYIDASQDAKVIAACLPAHHIYLF